MGLILWVAFCFWRYMVFLAIDTMEGLMPAALAITRDGWAAEDLRALARSSRDAEWTARLLAIALVLDGEGREAAGRAVGVDRQTVRDWVVRYNAAGPDGLRNRPRPGRAGWLCLTGRVGTGARGLLCRTISFCCLCRRTVLSRSRWRRSSSSCGATVGRTVCSTAWAP